MAEGSDHFSYGRILISRFCGLERQVGLAGPVGVDGHASDGDGRGAGSVEEGTREPRDVVLLHGDIEVALVQHVIVIIECRDLQGNVALCLV